MNVLMVTPMLPAPETGGTLAPLVRQIESVRKRGALVQVLEVRGPRMLRYPLAVPRIRQQARNVDVIHAHYGFCGWVARMQRERPVVVSFMGTDLLGYPRADGLPELSNWVQAELNIHFARTVDAIVVKSPEMAQRLGPLPCTVLPNGIDMDTFQPMDRALARARLGWSIVGPRVLFAGYPDDVRKGFALARATIDRAEASLGAPIELIPLRGVPFDQVPLYMNACDAMLFTSMQEGSPNVVKEAMACNLPVVSVPVGDVDLLLGDVAGSAVGPRDPEWLAETLLDTLETYERSNGRTRLLQKGLDQDTVARRLVDLYERVTEGRACAV